MSAINIESSPMPENAACWNEIIGQTATLPLVQIETEERECRPIEPIPPAAEGEGLLAQRLRELRTQQRNSLACPGGSYLKLLFQNELGSARLRVFGHDVLAKECEHVARNEDSDEALIGDARAFQRLNSKRRFKCLSTILGEEALSWLDGIDAVGIDENDPIKDVVARSLGRATVLRLEHSRPNSKTVLTVQKTGPLVDLQRMHDTLKAAMADVAQ